MSGWRIEDLDPQGPSREPRSKRLELGALVAAWLLGIAVLAGVGSGWRTEREPLAVDATPLPASPSDVRLDRSARVIVYVDADDPQRARQRFTLEGDRLLTGPNCVPARLGAPLPSPTLLVPEEPAGSGPLRWGSAPGWVLVSCYQALPAHVR